MIPMVCFLPIINRQSSSWLKIVVSHSTYVAAEFCSFPILKRRSSNWLRNMVSHSTCLYGLFSPYPKQEIKQLTDDISPLSLSPWCGYKGDKVGTSKEPQKSTFACKADLSSRTLRSSTAAKATLFPFYPSCSQDWNSYRFCVRWKGPFQLKSRLSARQNVGFSVQLFD